MKKLLFGWSRKKSNFRFLTEARRHGEKTKNREILSDISLCLRASVRAPAVCYFRLGCLGLVLTGCIEHNARVQPAPPESFQKIESDYPHASAIIGDRYERDWKSIVHRRDVIAAELAVDVWSIHPYGERRVYRSRLTTPLPWYQRFPCDLLLDLWPATVSFDTTENCVLLPCRTHTPAELDAAAFAAGYAVTMPAEHTGAATSANKIGN